MFHGNISSGNFNSLFFWGLCPSCTLLHMPQQHVPAPKPFLTCACSRRSSRPSAGGRRRTSNCNRKQLAGKRLMTSPRAYKQYSGRQPAQPIHTLALHMLVPNFYCQIVSNNGALELDYDYSKMEGLSKSEKWHLFYCFLKTLWLTTLEGDKGVCSNKIFHCKRTDRSNHHFCLRNF